jgi:hypothetical protein
MKERFSAAQVSKVLDQALIYQCACPAQVCRTIFELRELHDYQKNCGAGTDTDREVHATIAAAAQQAHAAMEECLAQVLRLEGWDMAALAMPENLRNKMRKPL